ncbi:hypothetical protein [Ornithinibacillus bavariensis]|uniref:hypothetical protein n=1 Tax=Ornithinibacillus bavariensis TaxID=545502 RepID=UPI000ED9803A|nr:hypothetical protein [Ornithinibacillus sp.]
MEIAAQEKSEGKEAGYAAGLTDGYNNTKENETVITGSNAYQEGYSTGYQQGFEEGKKKLVSERENAYKAGYDAAKEDLNAVVPANYSENDLVHSSYKEGYEKATAEIDAARKEEYYNIGYEDGKKDENNEPNDIKNIYVDSYKKGYKKGQQELEEKYIKLGYEATFTILEYKEPKLEKEKYIIWYKKGFDSNEEVEEIKKEAYELGLNGGAYELPIEYKESELLFSHYYEIGKHEYEKEQRKNTLKATGGIGVIVLSWLARRFYVARKTIIN